VAGCVLDDDAMRIGSLVSDETEDREIENLEEGLMPDIEKSNPKGTSETLKD
jgi:hypothetical protein